MPLNKEKALREIDEVRHWNGPSSQVETFAIIALETIRRWSPPNSTYVKKAEQEYGKGNFQAAAESFYRYAKIAPAGDKDGKNFSLTGGWNGDCSARTINSSATVLNGECSNERTSRR